MEHPFFASPEAEAAASADPPFRSPAEERHVHAQCHVLRCLNEAESVLTGWVLSHDRDEIAKLMHPLYELCDRDMDVEAPRG